MHVTSGRKRLIQPHWVRTRPTWSVSSPETRFTFQEQSPSLRVHWPLFAQDLVLSPWLQARAEGAATQLRPGHQTPGPSPVPAPSPPPFPASCVAPCLSLTFSELPPPRLFSCTLPSKKHTDLGFPGGSVVKNLSAVQETWVQPLGGEDPLEEAMAPHSRVLAWETPWTEDLGDCSPWGHRRVGHDLGKTQRWIWSI